MLQLHFDEALTAMGQWPARSVDALISDPPYATTDFAWDKPVDWAVFWREADRICKENAVVVLFSAQPFTTTLINSNPKNFRYELIWEKTRATGFLDANRRPLRAHENILMFSRKPRSTTYTPQKVPGKPYKTSHDGGKLGHWKAHRACNTDNAGTRHPRSVLHFASHKANGEHPTQKPLDLMRFLVLSYSKPGDVIFDPFMGSGSTGVAALEEHRRFVGIEREREYFDTAARRIFAAHGASALCPTDTSAVAV